MLLNTRKQIQLANQFLGAVVVNDVSFEANTWMDRQQIHYFIYSFSLQVTRDRFRQIWKYLHFSNREYFQNGLDKIKPVLHIFEKSF